MLMFGACSSMLKSAMFDAVPAAEKVGAALQLAEFAVAGCQRHPLLLGTALLQAILSSLPAHQCG